MKEPRSWEVREESVVAASEMQVTLQAPMRRTTTSPNRSGSPGWRHRHDRLLAEQARPGTDQGRRAGPGQLAERQLRQHLRHHVLRRHRRRRPAEVASFYKSEFFKKKLKGTPKVDAQFMATALATFFTSSNLSGGNVAASYGFNVTETGIGTKVVNVGSSGAAFGCGQRHEHDHHALLLATNNLTGRNATATVTATSTIPTATASSTKTRRPCASWRIRSIPRSTKTETFSFRRRSSNRINQRAGISIPSLFCCERRTYVPHRPETADAGSETGPTGC